jgi:hypothetical protein
MDPEHEQTDEQGRNPTQERMDDEGTETRLVDVDWDEPSPQEGDEEPTDTAA